MVKVAKLDPLGDEVETLLENCKHQGYDGVIVLGFNGNEFEALCGGKDNRKIPDTITIPKCCWVCDEIHMESGVHTDPPEASCLVDVDVTEEHWLGETIEQPLFHKCGRFQLKKELNDG